jgi:NAD(P)-dependent dehydrogenase (short-subunit alcohol dehydrogenase family)
MSKKLEGKVAVVTGGNSGIGLATAKRFAQEGAHVFITGRRQLELDRAASEIGPNATAVQADVSKFADLDRLYSAVKQRKGGIDVLFANAGVYLGDNPVQSITEKDFDNVFDTNVKGLVFTVQKALPLLRDGASVILTASVVSLKGFPGASVYSASKAAVRSFARSWTSDLKDRRIRVNTLSPGPIETPMTADFPKEKAQALLQGVPMARFGTADEIAKAAVFLASDDSSYVTGIELFVDGGTGQV